MSSEPNPFQDVPVFVDLKGHIIYRKRMRNAIGDKDELAYIKGWLNHGILLDDGTFVNFGMINFITPREAVS